MCADSSPISPTRKGLEAATVRPVYFLLRSIMATAVADGLIARTPCIGVDLPSEEQGKEMLFLTPAELARLAESIDPRFRALVLTAGYSDFRAGELSALKVDRVQSLRRRLVVFEAHSEVRGQLVTKSTKTRRRRRSRSQRHSLRSSPNTARPMCRRTATSSRPPKAGPFGITTSTARHTGQRSPVPNYRPGSLS